MTRVFFVTCSMLIIVLTVVSVVSLVGQIGKAAPVEQPMAIDAGAYHVRQVFREVGVICYAYVRNDGHVWHETLSCIGR